MGNAKLLEDLKTSICSIDDEILEKEEKEKILESMGDSICFKDEATLKTIKIIIDHLIKLLNDSHRSDQSQ